MFIKSFVTIFLALFYAIGVLKTRLVPAEDAPMVKKIATIVLTWVIQAMIGANIVVVLYQIWYQ